MGKRRRLVGLGAVTAGLLVGLPTLPAAAGPDASGRIAVFTEADGGTTIEEDFCGVEGLTVEFQESFRARGFATFRGARSIPHFTATSHYRATITELDTGTTVRINSNSVNKDVHIDVDGDLLTITALGAGGFRIAGPEGALRNPGRVFVQFVVDSNGTLQNPDDDRLVSGDVVLRPSTGLNEGTGDLCADYLIVTGRTG